MDSFQNFSMHLSDFVGQKSIKEILKININIALKNKTSLPHILLSGNPGLGKTTLAKIIANELNKSFIYVNGPTISKISDIVTILASVEENGIVFIDECHRMPTFIQEVLYTAMEEFKLVFIYENQENSKPINVDIAHFTLIGATTRLGLLSYAFRTRFPINIALEPYTSDDLFELLQNQCLNSKIEYEISALKMICASSRNTPRIARNILLNSINIGAYFDQKIDEKIVKKTLSLLAIDKQGLNKIDLKILNAMKNRFNGAPTSLESLSNIISEDVKDIEVVNEPFLVEKGYINRTKKGRVITEKGISLLK
ncbi:MAG: Holliday junction branch migration DNA helicase RuvB [Bacilli bacterium]